MARENTTWSNLGTTFKAENVAEALAKSGLDKKIVKTPVYLDGGIVIPDRFATHAAGSNHVLGIVSERYEIVQNYDAFAFVDNMVPDGVVMKRAGITATGMVYLIGSLPAYKLFGDKMETYLIFQNSHDGSCPVKAAICPLRIVCQNQFNVAFKKADNTIKIKHTSNANARLHEAKRVLQGVLGYNEQFARLAKELVKISLPVAKVDKVLEALYPVNEDMSRTLEQRALQARIGVKLAYEHTDDLGNLRGTGWGLLNAYSDYTTHAMPNRKTQNWEESRFVRSLSRPMNEVIDIIRSA